MRCVRGLGSLILIACLHAACQQNAEAIGTGEAGVTAPVILPTNLPVSTPKHCEELDGMVRFAATIDAAGVPHALKTLDASDHRLVGFATEVAAAQRFKPATKDGSPAAVAVELTVGLHTCAQRERRPVAGEFYDFTLRAHPLIALTVVGPPAAREVTTAVRTDATTAEQVGEHISAPIPTVTDDPVIPVSRKLGKRGLCILGLTIDANGIPQNVHVFRGLEPELDSNAMEAAKNWRFKPALRDGRTPVAVEGTIAATFENVEREAVAFAIFVPKPPEEVLAANAHHAEKQMDLEPLNADEVIARYKPRSRIAGLSLVAMVVDAGGVPQNVHIVKGVDSSLDMETVAMVEQLRFKPVLNDGATPVSVGVIVPVQYRVNTWKNVLYSIANISILLFA